MKYLLSLSCLLVSLSLAGQSQGVALTGGTLQLGNGTVLENATLTFKDGKIIDVTSAEIDLTGYKVIDVAGQIVYPGFILANTNLGLTEIAAVKATLDHSEVGAYNPNLRTLIAYNTDSELIPTFRFNGILTAQVAPRAGILAGTSSVVKLDAWNWEDAAIKTDDAVHLAWPRKFYGPRWWLGETANRPNKNYAKTVATLKAMFEQAKIYDGKIANSKLQGLAGVFETKQLFIRANSGDAIVESVLFAQNMGIENIVIVGAEEALSVADFLKKNNIPVLLSCLHRLPNQDYQNVNAPYQSAQKLQAKGLLVGLIYDIYATQSERNLPFIAGTAAAYGLSKTDALQMITSNVAKILKIDAQIGTLEKGKHATLFVSKGDALDMRTNQITHAFIQGQTVDLEGKQQKLYQKYKAKYK